MTVKLEFSKITKFRENGNFLTEETPKIAINSPVNAKNTARFSTRVY